MPIDDLLFEDTLLDPSEVGTGGMQGIRYSREKFKNEGWSDEEINRLNNTIRKEDKWARDFYAGKYENYEMARGFEHSVLASQGWGEEFSDYGKSSYDKKAKTRKDLENLQDLRAREQGTALKWVNGLGKCAVYAGTTALDSTIGTIWGVVEGIGTLNDGKDGTFWEKFYNNDFSRCMRDIQKASEEAMPNYQTKKEQNNPWYENIGTANFWADSILKNLGFTIGTFAGSALVGLVTGGTGLIPGLTRGFLTRVGVGARGVGVGEKLAMSAVSGWNEARQEAGNAYDDNLDRYKKEFIDMADDMGMVDWKYENFQSNTDKLTEEINYLQNTLDNGVLQTASGYDPETGMGTFTLEEIPQEKRAEMEARIQELTEERDKLFKLKDKYEDVEFRARASANSVMAVETVILALSNSIGALSGFKTFYSNAARNVELGITRGASKFADRAYYLGTKMFEESNEEMMQGWTNHTFADMYSVKYNYENRHKLLAGASSLELAFKDGFVKQYGTAEGWQDGVVGAVCGVIPNFMPHKVRKADGTTEMKWFQGGLVDIFSEDFKEADRVGEFLRNAEGDSKVEQAFKYLTEQSTLQDLEAKALQEGDKFNYENYHTKYLTNAILNYMAAGKLDDLKALIGSTDVTDEELDALIYASSEVGPDGKAKNNFGLTDKDGNLLVNTPEEREAYKKKLSEHRKNTFDLIDRLQKAINTIDNNTGGALKNEHLANLAWITVFPDELRKRYNKLLGEIYENENLRKFVNNLTKFDKLNENEEDTANKIAEIVSKAINKSRSKSKIKNKEVSGLVKAYDEYKSKNPKASVSDFVKSLTKKDSMGRAIEALYENLDQEFNGTRLSNFMADLLDGAGELDFSQEEKEKIISAMRDLDKLKRYENLYKNLAAKYTDTKPVEIAKVFDDLDNMFKAEFIGKQSKELENEIDKALKNKAPEKDIYLQLIKPYKESQLSGANKIFGNLLKGKHGKWIKGVENMVAFENALDNIVDNDESLTDSEKERIKNTIFYTLRDNITTPKEAFEKIKDSLNNVKAAKDIDSINTLFGKSSDLNEFMNSNKGFLINQAMELNMNMSYDPNTGSMSLSDEDLKFLMDLAKRIMVNDSISKAEALLEKAKEFFSEVEEWTGDLNDSKKIESMAKAMNEIESLFHYNNASETNIVNTRLDESASSITERYKDKLYEMKQNAAVFIEKMSNDAQKIIDYISTKKIEDVVSSGMVSYYISANSFFDIDRMINSKIFEISDNEEFLKRLMNCTYDEEMKVMIADMLNNKNFEKISKFKDVVKSIELMMKTLDSSFSQNDISVFSMSEDDIEDIKSMEFIIANLLEKLANKQKISENESDKLRNILNKIIERGLYTAAENTKDQNLRMIKENILSGDQLFTEEDLQSLAVDFNKGVSDIIEKEKEELKKKETRADIEKEAEQENDDVTDEELDESIKKDSEQNSKENDKIQLDENTIREIFKKERNGKKVNILQPVTSQMHIPSLRERKFITFSQGADIGNVNYHTDPHEIEAYLSNYKLGKTNRVINVFNMLNNGMIYDIWENGVYAHQLYAMTDEHMNNILNSNSEDEPKNYYWRVGSAENGQDTYYMYENEVIEYGTDNRGQKEVKRITSKDGGPLKLMKDANGKNIKRSEYTGSVIVKELGSDKKYSERTENMSNIVNDFRKLSIKANIFFAVRDNDGNLIPIGLMPRVENKEELRYGNVYSEEALGLQTSLNIIFGRTYGVGSPERELFDKAGTQLPKVMGECFVDGVKISDVPEKSSGKLYGGSFLNYQGKKGFELREIYEAEAFDYFSNYSSIAKSENPLISEITKSEDGKSVVVKYKNGEEYKYTSNRVNDQIGVMRTSNSDEGFLFFNNNNRSRQKRVLGNIFEMNDPNNAELLSKRKTIVDSIGQTINTLFDNTGNKFVREIGTLTEKQEVREGSKIVSSKNVDKTFEVRKGVRLDGYTIDNFINGVFEVEEKGIYNNLNDITTSDGISISTMLDMGDASLGVVLKGKGAASIRTSDGDIKISEGDNASSLKNGMSVLVLTNANGTKTNIPLGTARYTKETSKKLNEALGIEEYFKKAATELLTQIEKIKSIKDKEEAKKARINAVLEAFNHINNVINVKINKSFRKDGMDQKLHANLANRDGKYYLMIERKTDREGSKIEGTEKEIELTDENSVAEKLMEIVSEIERPLRIGDNVLNNSDKLKEYLEAGVFTTSLKSLTPVNSYFQVADGTSEITKEQRDANKKILGSFSNLLADIQRLNNRRMTEGKSFVNIGGANITIIYNDLGLSFDIYDSEGNKLSYDEINELESELGFKSNAPWSITDVFDVISKYKDLYEIIKNNSDETHKDKELMKSVLHGSIVRIRKMKGKTPVYAYYDFENGNIYFNSEAWDSAGMINNVNVGDPKTNVNTVVDEGETKQGGENNSKQETELFDSLAGNDFLEDKQEELSSVKSDNEEEEYYGDASEINNTTTENENKNTEEEEDPDEYSINSEKSIKEENKAIDALSASRVEFPYLSLGERNMVIKGLENVAKKGAKAWGEFKKNCTILYDTSSSKDEYRTNYHSASQLRLSRKERESLYSEIRNMYGDNLTNFECEEKLADMFMDYMLSGGNSSISSNKISKWFRELSHKIDVFRNDKDKVDSLFNTVYKGSYSGEYDAITSMYDNSSSLQSIGTREQYIDYIEEISKNSGINGIAYTTDFVTKTGEYIITQKQDSTAVDQGEFNYIGNKAGENTTVYIENKAYNRRVVPCVTTNSTKAKSVRNGKLRGKYALSSNPIILGSGNDISNFSLFIENNRMDESSERRKWNSGLSSETIAMLEMKGISVNEFNRMSDIIKDKIIECL